MGGGSAMTVMHDPALPHDPNGRRLAAGGAQPVPADVTPLQLQNLDGAIKVDAEIKA